MEDVRQLFVAMDLEAGASEGMNGNLASGAAQQLAKDTMQLESGSSFWHGSFALWLRMNIRKKREASILLASLKGAWTSLASPS